MTEETKSLPPDDSSGSAGKTENPDQDETQAIKGIEEKVSGINNGEAEREVPAKEGAKTEKVLGEMKLQDGREKAEKGVTDTEGKRVEGNAEAEGTAEERTAEKEAPGKEVGQEGVVEAETAEVVENGSSEGEVADVEGAEESDVDKLEGAEPVAGEKAESEIDTKEEAQVEEDAGEEKQGSGENLVESEETRVFEGKTEAEELTEEKTAESEEGETATEEGAEGKKSVEEKTTPESAKVEKEGEIRTEEEESGEDSAEEERGVVVAEGEEEAAGLVSSKEIGKGTAEEVTDEEWVTWKKEFLAKFQKNFNKKGLVYGTGAFMLVAGLVIFLMGSNLRFAGTGETRSLEEIAGPIYDMKFFLPLESGEGKTSFVKVTVAIELVDKGYRREIEKKVSELRKQVVDLVLSKSPKEVKSSQGKEKLRKEITSSLNKCLVSEGIKNTYFTELVVL